jgi:hypothetical protein
MKSVANGYRYLSISKLLPLVNTNSGPSYLYIISIYIEILLNSISGLFE